MGLKAIPRTARWIHAEVLSGRLAPPPGHPANPDSGDLGGTNGALDAAGPSRSPYVYRVDSTSSTANLQGITAPDAQVGDILVLMGAEDGPTNAVTVVDNAAVTNAFQMQGGTSETIDAASDVIMFVFDGTDWSEIQPGGGN